MRTEIGTQHRRPAMASQNPRTYDLREYSEEVRDSAIAQALWERLLDDRPGGCRSGPQRSQADDPQGRQHALLRR